MKELLLAIRQKAQDELAATCDEASLEEARVRYLGKKGELTAVLRGMGKLTPEERPAVGQLANEVRETIEGMIAERKTALQAASLEKKLKEEKIDVTAPGKKIAVGERHPLAKVEEELRTIFTSMGFDIVEGPEVEYDHYNFEKLNIPKDHPARDTQDTFYITENILLRSQTSPVQVRTMEVQKPPIRIISPGRVYRSDAVDATHSPVFHQLEGLVVDKGITMGDLRACLNILPSSSSVQIPSFVFVRTTSRSPNRLPRLTFPASCAAARAAVFARARVGSKFSVPAWYTPTF